MLREEIDMVVDHHQVTNLEVGIHASCRIRHKELFDAQFTHDTFRERYLFHGVPLIIMEPAFHGHDVFSSEFSEDKLSCVPLYGRLREVGYVGIGKSIGVSYLGS